MASWEPRKLPIKEFEVVTNSKYDQMVAELSEVLYSYYHQLHSVPKVSSEFTVNAISSRAALPENFNQEDSAL